MNDQSTEPMQPKTKRPSIDIYFLRLARLVGTRSTCRHRDQGAVLVKNHRIISTGYNGSPPGQPHCIDLTFCAKEKGMDCRAEGLHGESNALLTAAKLGASTEGAVLYCTYSPCKSCCNMLSVAGIIGVIYEELYPDFPTVNDYLKELGIWAKQASSTS